MAKIEIEEAVVKRWLKVWLRAMWDEIFGWTNFHTSEPLILLKYIHPKTVSDIFLSQIILSYVFPQNCFYTVGISLQSSKVKLCCKILYFEDLAVACRECTINVNLKPFLWSSQWYSKAQKESKYKRRKAKCSQDNEGGGSGMAGPSNTNPKNIAFSLISGPHLL